MAPPNQQEQEAKFEITPSAHAQLFSSTVVFDGYSTHSLGTIVHTDTYFDTHAYDLLRHGFALRIRQAGSKVEIGLKSIQAERKGAVQSRSEIAFPLVALAHPLDPASWPTAVSEQLATYNVKIAELRPIVIVRQERQKAHLHSSADAIPLAEWSVDAVRIHVADNGKHHSGDAARDAAPDLTFHELEIERLVNVSGAQNGQDAEQRFTDFVATVQARFDLKPIYTSKLIRGLEAAIARGHAGHAALTPTMHLAAAGRLLLHQQLFQILLNEHGIRQTKRSRYVHDMRVAIRRARAALEVCANIIPAESLAPHAKALRRLARRLGAVRDLDVALSNLRAFARAQPDTHPTGLKLLRAKLRERRAHAHADLLKLLNSKKHRKFITNLLAFCVEPVAPHKPIGGTPEVLPVEVRHTVPSILLAAFERVRAYETVMSGASLPPLETFHALRIQAKYLRYLLEFTQHLFETDGEELVEQLRDLQAHLGELNDAHVEHMRLQEWQNSTTAATALHAAITTRLAEVTTRLQALASATPAQLDALISPNNRAKLAQALARL